jgi:hypothetical protein
MIVVMILVFMIIGKWAISIGIHDNRKIGNKNYGHRNIATIRIKIKIILVYI